MVASKVTTYGDQSITGSWHNSGYYGHFRSRIRNDFMNEYRQRAKPSPPQKYIERAQGNGRRQVHGSSAQYKPNFIAWIPHKKEFMDNRQPLTSVYKSIYHKGARGYADNPLQQQYSTQIAAQADKIRQKFNFEDERAVYTDGYTIDPRQHFQTTYRKAHCIKDPRDQEAKYINTITTRSANIEKMSRTSSAQPNLHRESVASCLSWTPYRPHTTVPNAPEYVDHQRLNGRKLEATPLIPPEQSVSSQLPTVQNKQDAPTLVC